MDQAMVRRLGAEFLGTFILVLGGCGSAVLAAKLFVLVVTGTTATPTVFATGVGLVGIALAFGLTVLGGVFVFGHISGGHFNPAVTIGLATARRFPWGRMRSTSSPRSPALSSRPDGGSSPSTSGIRPKTLCRLAVSVNWLRRTLSRPVRRHRWHRDGSRLHGDLRARDPRRHRSAGAKGLAAVAIGLTLTMIHLATIPVTGTSVNPARSTGPALVALLGGESWPVEQLWLFWVAPVAGAFVGGVVYGFVGQPADGGAGEQASAAADL